MKSFGKKRKIIFKNFGYRIVAILTFVIALLIVRNSSSDEISARFLVNLTPQKESITQNRNLSEYVFGGEIESCQFGDSIKTQCELDTEKARKFIFEHWKNRKRAYIILIRHGSDCVSDYHVFIEPASGNTWRIVFNREFSDDERGFSGNISSEESRNVTYKVATTDDQGFRVGERFLEFTNSKGEVESVY